MDLFVYVKIIDTPIKMKKFANWNEMFATHITTKE